MRRNIARSSLIDFQSLLHHHFYLVDRISVPQTKLQNKGVAQTDPKQNKGDSKNVISQLF